MDLATALAISARTMDVPARQLRAVAETLADGDAPSGVARLRGDRGGNAAWPGAPWPQPGADLTANLDALRATRALLSRTVDALR